MIKIKRVYDKASRGDGTRVLVDRLWPRGIKKEKARVNEWLKEIGPSNELRKWFGHEPQKWGQFKRRYFKELRDKREELGEIRKKARAGDVTLLFGARDTQHNNAVALREYLEGLRKA